MRRRVRRAGLGASTAVAATRVSRRGWCVLVDDTYGLPSISSGRVSRTERSRVQWEHEMGPGYEFWAPDDQNAGLATADLAGGVVAAIIYSENEPEAFQLYSLMPGSKRYTSPLIVVVPGA